MEDKWKKSLKKKYFNNQLLYNLKGIFFDTKSYN
jgi:hypothetical protein